MRLRSAVTIGIVAAVAAGLTGCPSDSCPLESPQVSATPGTCTAVQGQPVNYPVRLCPACNQTGATCAADVSQAQTGYIYLDVKMQACSGGNSCPPPSCNANPNSCTFTAPSAGNYTVVISDGQGGTISNPLQVVANGTPSCALPAAAL